MNEELIEDFKELFEFDKEKQKNILNKLITDNIIKGDKINIDSLISQSIDKSIRLDRISGSYNKELLTTTWDFNVTKPGKYKIHLLSNEKARHSNPKWVGSEQKGIIEIDEIIIPVELKRDEEKINSSLFFYKEITSYIGNITFPKKGKYKLILRDLKIDAGKWTDGLGLNYIELIPLE